MTTGAYRAVEFIKANIKLEGVTKASVEDSKKVVEICTQYAQKGMINIFLTVFFGTLAFAFFDPYFFIAYLISIALFGLYQAIFMANAGGSTQDNAQKIVEVEMKAKGTPLHDATVVGDTVGDPFKDTSSVALNPIIKFSTLFGLLAVSLAVSLSAKGGNTAPILGVVFLSNLHRVRMALLLRYAHRQQQSVSEPCSRMAAPPVPNRDRKEVGEQRSSELYRHFMHHAWRLGTCTAACAAHGGSEPLPPHAHAWRHGTLYRPHAPHGGSEPLPPHALAWRHGICTAACSRMAARSLYRRMLTHGGAEPVPPHARMAARNLYRRMCSRMAARNLYRRMLTYGGSEPVPPHAHAWRLGTSTEIMRRRIALLFPMALALAAVPDLTPN